MVYYTQTGSPRHAYGVPRDDTNQTTLLSLLSNQVPNSQLALGVGKNPNLDISQVIETVKDIPDSWLALGVGENPHAQYRYFLQIHNLSENNIVSGSLLDKVRQDIFS